MTSENSVRQRITQMSAEVHGGPSLQRALQQGRARRRRRAIAAIGSGVATACVIGAVAGTVFPGAGTGDGERQESLPVTAPEDVPQEIKRAVREHLPANSEITATEVTAYPSGSSHADPPELPRGQWDRAGSWLVEFELGPGEIVRVGLTDFAEDDVPDSEVRRECATDPDCADFDVDGAPAALRTEAMTRLGENKWIVGVDADVPDQGTVWTRRALTVHLDGPYRVGVSDAVHEPTQDQAQSAWTLDPETMRAIATDEDVLAGADGG